MDSVLKRGILLAMERGPAGNFHEQPSRIAAIDALWSHAPAQPREVRVPADGCIDLIVRLRAGRCTEALVHEPTVSAHRAVIAPDEHVLGVRLRAGFGGPLLAHMERVNRMARARFRDGGELRDLEALIGELEGELDPPALVRDFLALARETRGRQRLSTAAPLGPERRLQRAAQQWLGTTPKTFLRIERVLAARTAIREGARLSEVAFELGYADQAHLTREVRALLGVSPRALRPVGILQDPMGRAR